MPRTLMNFTNLPDSSHTWLPPNPNGSRGTFTGCFPQIRGMVTATEPPTIQNSMLKVGTLTDDAIRNRSLTKAMRRERMEANQAGKGVLEIIIRGLKGQRDLWPLTLSGNNIQVLLPNAQIATTITIRIRLVVPAQHAIG